MYLEKFGLRGRTAVVTGGGRGLGRAIATGLARHGARLVLCGRNEETVRDAAEALGGDGAEVLAVAADVSREEDVLRLRDAALERFGQVDVLVNNAGVNPIFKGIERTTFEEWSHIVGTNLGGVFLCCKHIGALMAQQGDGSVINVSSVAGHVGLRRSVPYNATKGGVELLTKALALDWATKGVRVNCLAPGYFETDLTAGLRGNETLSGALLAQVPQGRYGTDRDLVGAAVFLASPASAYVTGQSLLVDGGWTAQ